MPVGVRARFVPEKLNLFYRTLGWPVSEQRSVTPETLAAQGLGEADPLSGGLVPVINLSTNYEQQRDGTYRDGRVYTRADNPTSEHAERLLAALEGGTCTCALFGSGMAAATAVFQSLLPADHVLVSRVLYWGVRKWLAEFALTWGLDVEFARRDPFWERIRSWRRNSGAMPGPFEAWLLQRGMRTLFLRVSRASQTAMAIAARLDRHPALTAVLYPGLPGHPGHQVAARQMAGGFGGMLSIRLAEGAGHAHAVLREVRVFKRATSLGGVESLIERRRSGPRCRRSPRCGCSPPANRHLQGRDNASTRWALASCIT